MRRREFVTLLGVAAAWPLATRAQQGRIFKIGFVTWQSQAAEDQLKYLREGLAQFGYVEGRNISLEAFFTDGDPERTRTVLRAQIDKQVDILIVRVSPVAQIAKEMTRTVPIVMLARKEAFESSASLLAKTLPKLSVRNRSVLGAPGRAKPSVTVSVPSPTRQPAPPGGIVFTSSGRTIGSLTRSTIGWLLGPPPPTR